MFFGNDNDGNSGVKRSGTAVYPVHAEHMSGLLTRCEPLLDVDEFKSLFLKGINLKLRNGDVITDRDLKKKLNWAMNEVELLIGSPIMTEHFRHKVAFDYTLYKSYIHIMAEKGPIVTLSEIAIVSADNNNIFNLPADWIETTNFSKRLINVIPLLAAYGVNSVGGAVGNAGIAFLTVMDGLNFVPAYWQIKYTAGLSNTEGQVPIPVNQLIGAVAAIDVISQIAATFIYNSQSQTQDGISQSSSGPGPNVYARRLQDLSDQRDKLVKQLRSIFSTRYIIGSI
jgi:hypothetical protein